MPLPPGIVAGSGTDSIAVCTENLNPNVMVMKSTEDCV
jgi:hypothetical protein